MDGSLPWSSLAEGENGGGESSQVFGKRRKGFLSKPGESFGRDEDQNPDDQGRGGPYPETRSHPGSGPVPRYAFREKNQGACFFPSREDEGTQGLGSRQERRDGES